MNYILYQFIWNDKPEKIKRTIINKSYDQGGLKMIDLEKFVHALQLTWVKRYFEDKNSQWSIIMKYNVREKNKFFEMGSLWQQKLKKTVTNPFYYDLLNNWQQFLEAVSLFNPMCMPLWYNPLISKSELFIKNLYSNGCIYVADAYYASGELLSCKDLNELYNYHCNFLDYHRL